MFVPLVSKFVGKLTMTSQADFVSGQMNIT